LIFQKMRSDAVWRRYVPLPLIQLRNDAAACMQVNRTESHIRGT
jgi:hypothetical protein